MAFAHPRDELLAKSKETGLAVQDEAFAKQLDSEDELKEYRDKFHFPQTKEGKNVVYMVGNSLGPQHKGVRDSVGAFLDKWATVGINGHFVQPDPWFEIDELLTPAMAKIVGAQTSEVALMQTLTANLHLLMAAFYKPVGKKRKILIEKHPFPSDMYAVRSQLRLKGSDPDEDLIEVGMEDEVRAFDEELIIKTIEERGDEIAMVMLAGVHFLTGQFFDIERITAVAKKHGCVVGWDLAHAAGNCILKLHDWKVDFACWCTYKYMCSGPGNIGGAFVHSDVDLSKVDRLEGWWGNARQSRFDLKHNFKGTEGAASFQLSNPSVACIASIRPCLEMMAGIGMDRLRKKSVLLTGYLEHLLATLTPKGIQVLSPTNIERRGAQLSIRVVGELVTASIDKSEYECGTNTGNKASVLQAQMEECGIVCDNRPPDVLRLPPVPMYNSFHDVWLLVTTLQKLVKEE